MKLSCGTDITEIPRIKEAIEKQRRNIYKKNIHTKRNRLLRKQEKCEISALRCKICCKRSNI